MKNVNISPGGNANAGKNSPVGAIVGGVIGGLAFLLLIVGAVFFWRRRRIQQSRVVVDLQNENPQPQPFITQYYPINANDSAFQFPKPSPTTPLTPTRQEPLSEPRPEPIRIEGSYSDASGPNHQLSPSTPTLPSPQFQPLSTKQREALQQNRSHQYQPSESAVSSLTTPYTASGSGREDALRAEVDELRREMEAIRNIAQPPPSYQ
jgi:hypothetical protein